MTCGIQSYTYRIQRSVCHALIFRFQRKIRYHYTIRPHFQIENLKKTDKFESVVEFTSSYRIYFFKSATLVTDTLQELPIDGWPDHMVTAIVAYLVTDLTQSK